MKAEAIMDRPSALADPRRFMTFASRAGAGAARRVLPIAGLVSVLSCAGPREGPHEPAVCERIPILYSTDLHHPPVDPDDHFDLATLFALDELDLRGIVLDDGARQQERPGRIPVAQMIQLTGRRVPYAVGLGRRLTGPEETRREEPAEFQGGVELILRVLRDSPRPVTIITVGSCNDVAAALNREPDLFRRRLKALYINIGTGPGGLQRDYNVGLGKESYARLLTAGLPLYWCPCAGTNGYLTEYFVEQAAVAGAGAPGVRNYFAYALTGSWEDPIRGLAGGPRPAPPGPRGMWSTASLLHAAGRRIYRRGEGDFVALTPSAAAEAGLADRETRVYEFRSARLRVDRRPETAQPIITPDFDAAQPDCRLFHVTDPRYAAVMGSVLKNLIAGLGRAAAPPAAAIAQAAAVTPAAAPALAETVIEVESMKLTDAEVRPLPGAGGGRVVVFEKETGMAEGSVKLTQGRYELILYVLAPDGDHDATSVEVEKGIDRRIWSSHHGKLAPCDDPVPFTVKQDGEVPIKLWVAETGVLLDRVVIRKLE
jgi:hypothetical protein